MFITFRSDAEQSMFQRNELEAVSSRVLETKRPPLKGIRLVPVNTSVPENAREWGYDRVDHQGKAAFLGERSTSLPMADATKDRVLYRLHHYGQGYEYSKMEINQAVAGGATTLNDQRAMAALRATEEMRNRLMLLGDDRIGTEGFVNSSIVPATPAGGTWSALVGTSVDDLIAEIASYISTFRVNSGESITPNVLAIPEAQYTLLESRRLGDTDSTMLAYVRNAFADSIQEIVNLAELQGAGAGATDRAVLYRRDLEVLEYAMSRTFRFEAPVEHTLKWEVPGWETSCAGTNILMPLGMLYIDGI